MRRQGGARETALLRVHENGGVYDGEWAAASDDRGDALKSGFGVYAYQNGDAYEGEWRANVKEGRGVYTFRSGAFFAGEWRRGVQHGLGIRKLRDGKIRSGRWVAGKLEIGDGRAAKDKVTLDKFDDNGRWQLTSTNNTMELVRLFFDA